MPNNGTYLLTNVGFSSSERPLLLLENSSSFITLHPLDATLTLRFDTTQRYCIGWRDITTRERFACPDHHAVGAKYEQCSACQKRTGFNPAFYHATTVSPQQENRNLQPHILYLAHFGQGLIKVGISLAARGNSRLLEQGARTALILESFPSAHVARQYEAQIATLPGIVETLQQRKKSELLTKPYDAEAAKTELFTLREKIEKTIGISFSKSKYMHYDRFYFPETRPDLSGAYDATRLNMISGKVLGMVGSALFCQNGESILYLPLKKYIGYTAIIDDTIATIETPARQTSLF